MRIDAHHHFWRYDPAEFGWIGDDMAGIRHDFLPTDLQSEIAAAGVDGVVSVQARQTLGETRWLLDLAEAHPWVRGVVGWVDLRAPDLPATLVSLARSRKLVGVRHVVQAEADGFLLDPAFNRGIRELRPHGLVYDLLLVERQLPDALRFADAHPNQSLVVDHLAKPAIRTGEREPWRSHLRDLARRPQVTCKISGMVTEADLTAWTPDALKPYFEVALEAFGPNRLMFGSDWPVCLAACGYRRWVETVEAWIAPLSASERERIRAGTACETYGL
jgi:L-fuconolactonase